MEDRESGGGTDGSGSRPAPGAGSMASVELKTDGPPSTGGRRNVRSPTTTTSASCHATSATTTATELTGLEEGDALFSLSNVGEGTRATFVVNAMARVLTE